MKKANKEFRAIDEKVEIRFDETAKTTILSGYAAVFDDGTEGSRYQYGDITETIKAGAFARAIRDKQDVRALFNHESGQVLGRISSGTLRISEDTKGLRYELDLPNTSLGNDIKELVSRGDISGSSFGFRIKAETWTALDERAASGRKKYKREISDLDLIDVSPVTFPAYTGTEAKMRSEDYEDLIAEAEAKTTSESPESEAEAKRKSEADIKLLELRFNALIQSK